MNTEGYWISPQGKIIPLEGGTHIDMIIKNPETFGLTPEYVNEVYNEYGEKLGTEGQARESIIKALIDKGWIRIRRYRNMGWSVNINRLGKKIKDFLFNWAERLTSSDGLFGLKEQDVFIPVKIISFGDSLQHEFTFKDILRGRLYEQTEKFDAENVLLECRLIKNKFYKWKALIEVD